MNLSKRINFVRKISLSLFLFSLISIFGSLWLHNVLVDFNFKKSLSAEDLEISKTYSKSINCSKNLNDCKRHPYLNLFNNSKNLGDCIANGYKKIYILDNSIIPDVSYLFIDNNVENNLKPEFVNKEIILKIEFLKTKNNFCIKNYKHYYLYNFFPYFFESLHDLKKNPKTQLGTTVSINPFINGEASISNIVKRFPINFIFKTFLFISVIFMYLYWNSYKHLFTEILESNNKKFFYFGIASAVFLFFHVLFLGMEIDNKVFKLIRKLVIIFFILSEILAQYFLSIQLFKNKKKLIQYCNSYIINIKLLFVIIIALVSFIVIAILLIYDLSSKVDYILEWNYFAGLLFFYFLSFLMWKKKLI